MLTSDQFITTHHFTKNPHDDDLIFIIHQEKIVLTKTYQIPIWQQLKILNLPQQNFYCFGTYQKKQCLLVDIPENLLPTAEYQEKTVREYVNHLEPDSLPILGLAKHLQHWRSTHLFCGRCGHKMQDKLDERAKQCTHCQSIYYPRITPCIIVLITRDRDLLLARSKHFPTGIYSTLAGFIEIGESVEHAVHREVYEEVGITIKNLNYISSQPWPFPDSLMLGFIAEYATGELKIDSHELEDAKWFSPENLPLLPSPLGISRMLIEKHLKNVAIKI